MEIIRLNAEDGTTLASGTAAQWRRAEVEARQTGIATYAQKGNDMPVDLVFPMHVFKGLFLGVDWDGILGT